MQLFTSVILMYMVHGYLNMQYANAKFEITY